MSTAEGASSVQGESEAQGASTEKPAAGVAAAAPTVGPVAAVSAPAVAPVAATAGAPASTPAAAPTAKPAAPAAAKPAVAPAKKPAPVAAKPAAAKPVTPAKPATGPIGIANPSGVLDDAGPATAAAITLGAGRGASAARELRKQRARRIGFGLALWVGFPFLASIIYYGFIAQPEFESVGKFALRGTEQAQRLAMLREHMTSRESLDALERKQHFTEHYSQARDPFMRLSKRAGSERQSAVFNRNVTVDSDSHTGIVTLRVRAYTASKAQAFAKTISDEGKRFLTELGGRSRIRALELANERLSKAQAKLESVERASEEKPPSESPGILAVRRSLAEREFEAALRAVDTASEAAGHEETPLVVVAAPSLPNEPSYPRRLYGVATVLFVSLLLFGIGSLLIAAVREHAQF
jgi:capsule polysaccharide export protein KpsE/RkpR